VHVHHGVDQADGPTVGRIVDDHLEGRRSTSWLTMPHTSWGRLGRRSTRCSRGCDRGGIYVIEDWSWAHVGYGAHRPTEDRA
jgi:hypothetical protein